MCHRSLRRGLVTVGTIGLLVTMLGCRAEGPAAQSSPATSVSPASTSLAAAASAIGPPPDGFCDAVAEFQAEVNRVFTPPADQGIDPLAQARLPELYAALVEKAPDGIREGMALGQGAASGASLGVGPDEGVKAKVKLAGTYILEQCRVQLFGELDRTTPPDPNTPSPPPSSVTPLPGRTVPPLPPS